MTSGRQNNSKAPPSKKKFSNSYTWSAFSVVRNEEKHIQDVIDSIQAQDPPPLRILVANHGSTDQTGEILNSINGIKVTHHKPIKQTYLPKEFFEIRNNLFKEASSGVDYVMCVDGDTVIPNSYVNDIVERMRRDNVVIACGQDPSNKVSLVVESPSIVDAKWLAKFCHPTRTTSMNTSTLLVHASLTGFRTAVYADIPVEYKRKISANSNHLVIQSHGRQFKQNGFSFWYVLVVAIKRRNLHYINGYITTKRRSDDGQMILWWKKYQHERVFGKLGMSCSLLKNTDTAVYVEPI